ncbi:MAG: HD domain-containing protein [Fervidicoccaceae archaeon]|jgi:putative hydrolase of HD superfamily|nr:MAG: hypothetical protein C0177_02115 [Fervidicoccus fontis]
MEKLNACIEALKSSARTGWMQRGVPPGMAENIASHSFEVAIISLIIAEKAKEYGIEVNLEKTVALAILHDFPECITGDINYYTKKVIGVDTKHRLELEAMKEVFYDDKRFFELYMNYSEKNCLEARIVELADKIATINQAKRYMRYGFDFSEMILNLRKEIDAILNEMNEEFKKIYYDFLK